MKPLRVLLITDFAPNIVNAGSERLVFGIAQGLNKQYAVKADILAPNWNNLPEEEVVDGVTIHRFKTHSIRTLNSSNAARRVFDFMRFGAKLGRYDLYQGFYTLPPLMAAVLLAKFMQSKSIITFFGREQLEKRLTKLAKFPILAVLNCADKITTYTWKLASYFSEKAYFKNKAITTIQGWGDTELKVTGHTMVRTTPKEKIILFVGRLAKEKGVYVLLNAFSKIKARGSAKLVLIGPPYEEENVKREIKRLGIGNKVNILGFVSDEDLEYWYLHSYVVAVPALHRDGFGLSLMEAMVRGKPIIGTEGVGTPDNTQELGIIEPGDAVALADYLEKMLTDKTFYSKCLENAKARSKLFIKEQVIKKYYSTYLATLNNK